MRGLPASSSVEPFIILGALAAVFFGLSWLRLGAIARTATRRSPEPAPAPAFAGVGMGDAMFAEMRRVLNDRGVFGLIVMAPVLYGILYPQPYLGQLLRKIPIAVVDQDHTEVSRDLVQALNADEAVTVAVRADTLADAHAALARREVFAILGIPKDTEREVLKGNKARLAAYVDSAYFLLFNRTLEGISEASGAVTEEIAEHGARTDGSLAHAAVTRASPVELLSQPLVQSDRRLCELCRSRSLHTDPAADAVLRDRQLGRRGLRAGRTGSAAAARTGTRAIIGQAVAHLCLAMPGLALYLIILPRIYGFSTLGNVLELFLFAVPFVLSVSFQAQFVSMWFKRRETAVVLFIAVSLPLFFMVGVSWPVEAIPDTIRAASRIFPSTSAIPGFVRIDQMGATLHDVWRDWTTLWTLTAVYGLLAVAAGRLFVRERVADGRLSLFAARSRSSRSSSRSERRPLSPIASTRRARRRRRSSGSCTRPKSASRLK